MRGALYFLAAASVAATATWAYRVNYAVIDMEEAVADLRRDIAEERETALVLKADWAWLNAPERLERLAEAHRAELGLVPLAAAHFATAEEIAPPPPESYWARATLNDFAAGLGVAAPSPRPARLSR